MLSFSDFQKKIWAFHADHKRDLPWRTPRVQPDPHGHLDLYGVLVSEMMLQQTQVTRVLTKYPEFLSAFPDFASLAAAPLPEVLRAWQGLGYNRRGKYLWQTAQVVLHTHWHTTGMAISIPMVADVDALPGIGPATAASICCFTYNQPVVFIETNIRKVYLYHFFPDQDQVHDDQVMAMVAQTLDVSAPREWYYALMDYGAYLSTVVENPNTKSRHYVRQSKFAGSDRQIRGRLLREHLQGHSIAPMDERERKIWSVLQKEKLVA